MSGETEKNVSAWTTDSLKEYFEALIKSNDQRYEQRFKDQAEAVKAALASAERAVEKAEANAEKWRMNANEWRGAMNDRERNLMPRSEAEKSIAANSEKVDALATRIERSEGRSSGLDTGWKVLIGAVGLIATLATLFALWKR